MVKRRHASKEKSRVGIGPVVSDFLNRLPEAK